MQVAASNQPVPLGRRFGSGSNQTRPDHLLDELGEKIKEDFLMFLQRCRDLGNGAVGMLSSTPTSEMLTTTGTISSEPPALTLSSAPAVANAMPIYVQQLHEMRNEGQNTLYVDFAHVLRFNEVLATAILDSYYRYGRGMQDACRFEPFLVAAVRAFVEAYLPSYVRVPSTDVERAFWLSFYNLDSTIRLRELTTQRIGQLMSISGTVTRTSEVRPELMSGAFRCGDCYTAYAMLVPQQFKYTEPPCCTNRWCGNRSVWTLLPEASRFANWQRIRLQENASEIPAGSMPRTMDVVLRNELVERAKAGDRCTFTGCLIVVPDVAQLGLPGNRMEAQAEAGRSKNNPGDGVTGLKALGVRDLTYKLAFLACMVQTSTASSGAGGVRFDDDAMLDASGTEDVDPRTLFTAAELEEIASVKSSTPNLYQRLVDSVAPSIYGHAEIKAGILLMLFGGVHKTTPEGINLRGDINICIVGDPGTAKSHFLRYVVGFLPRSVYTSGKSSSAAGLTASVVKDEETGDFTIEAGALMLADNGICAIDEFDKMDLADQVAIHEAMEQQTISISKAGIQATLNARTSILAAANPIAGRYDRRRTLRQNIAMTAPIMSRFDLFFVILDEPGVDASADYAIAQHILAMHQHRDLAVQAPFSTEQMQRYIRYARTIRPKISREAADLLVDRYKALRQSDASGFGTASYRMTVRQLESMVRLSEAIARLHLDPVVSADYVREAARLLKSSVIRVETENIDLQGGDRDLRATQLRPAGGSVDCGEDARIMSIKYEDYMRIGNQLVYLLRRHDLEARETVSAANADDGIVGMSKDALMQAFLESIEREIHSVEELAYRSAQVSSAIDRLVHKDGVLIELTPESKDAEVTIVVHPNYVPSD